MYIQDIKAKQLKLAELLLKRATELEIEKKYFAAEMCLEKAAYWEWRALGGRKPVWL